VNPDVATQTQQLYERTLVLRSQLGDETAMRELLTRLGPRLSFFIRKMLNSRPETVEDAIQETWAAIFRGLAGLRETGKFRAWAYGIARRRVYQEYRRRKEPTQSLDEAGAEELPGATEPEPAVSADEVRRGLEAIPEAQREALWLHYFEEMSYEEIARVTGASLGTVRSRMHYGKRALKSALERQQP
jgi:RNA polymerase sigma-70 factor (ECF subfamily)